MAFTLGHEAIREATEVHTALLTLTTSCRIYNLLEGALAQESSKVLKRREEAPDCCFTHTVKLAHGPARGRNAVHITCSAVCGCPDSSSSEPLRHHLLHDGEPNASPAMQPASLRSSTRTFGICQRLCR
ncbi:hypothetical protein D4764_14G0007930 [Takifugu flavidus]|uniref:Uncharacterized protein n=1 Tax=Takifugu flavidus TaxID=433684 RepID=A0A5C6P993_9TELE|nr:hypothetical protein D4764_14G0007930 [Takifugu flavidus]